MDIKGYHHPYYMARGIDSERSMDEDELVLLITLRVDHPSCSKEAGYAAEPGQGDARACDVMRGLR